MTATLQAHMLELTDTERATLLDILQELLKETEVEHHRTEAFAAKQVVASRAQTIEALLNKVRGS